MRPYPLVVLLLVVPLLAIASDRTARLIPVDASDRSAVLVSTGLAGAKADTVYLLGGPDRTDGKFQDDADPSLPDWEGWTSVDLTERTEEIWHIDTWNSPTGTAAMWCGEVFASCGLGDPAEGYGNDYEEILAWSATVASPAADTDVTLTYDLNYDNEPGYDYLYVQYEAFDGWRDLIVYNGSTYDQGSGSWAPLIGETITFTVPAGELAGAGADELHIRILATSDGGWSDSDCLWPTSGHCTVDEISVSGSNGVSGTYDDFEGGMGASNWQVEFPTAVGDFAAIWSGLVDLDPCSNGNATAAAFIDDGVVVPCTGGTLGTTWTYGPGSFVHNLTGGCFGPSKHAHNQIWSPALAWVDEAGSPLGESHAGAELEFDVYRHLPLDNGMFYVWHVRCSDDGGSTWRNWRSRNFVYYGTTHDWIRVGQNVTDLMSHEPTHVQISLGIHELGWVWGFIGTDGTPAPYFDNVAFKTYVIDGPAITAKEAELAQDNFPTIGDIDLSDLGANDIRFDMASDILGDASPAILPGDSLVADIKAVRPGAVLNSRPRLYYTMKTNPLFDPYRLHPTSGYVEGDTVYTDSGVVHPDRYSFDLPDEDFFFPGDVIHYYVWGEDNQAGDIGVTTLPASLDGFGDFVWGPGFNDVTWPESFTVRGLPTIRNSLGTQPEILLWDDAGKSDDLGDWIYLLNLLSYYERLDFDVYCTNSPSSALSNGLGSRATISQISGYETIIYTAGDLSAHTLCGHDQVSDKSDDLGLLHSWLLNGRNLMITGDNVASDLATSQGAAGSSFLSQWMSVSVTQSDVSPLLGGLTTPIMRHEPDNPAFVTVDLVALGGCPSIKSFDAVIGGGTTAPIWSWDGYGGSESAGVCSITGGSMILTVPVDFASWGAPENYTPPPGYYYHHTARGAALGQILFALGYGHAYVGVDPIPALGAMNAPNPFNPLTEIRYTVPSRGPVSVRVYNVRGELVRTLVDEDVEAGAHSVRWQGRDDRGSSAASGVYFYEVRTGGEAVVGKMSLVR